VISPAEGRARSEAAGELRYLSIRLQGYVAELPDRSLPPRGRVQWSPAELGELGVLTRALGLGEEDAARAVASLGAIDMLIQRTHSAADAEVASDTAAANLPAEVSLLERYLAQRAIAMDSLPRLQRLGEPAQAAARHTGAPQQPSIWQSLWSRTVARILARSPR
jgi:hypothetical protein